MHLHVFVVSVATTLMEDTRDVLTFTKVVVRAIAVIVRRTTTLITSMRRVVAAATPAIGFMTMVVSFMTMVVARMALVVGRMAVFVGAKRCVVSLKLCCDSWTTAIVGPRLDVMASRMLIDGPIASVTIDETNHIVMFERKDAPMDFELLEAGLVTFRLEMPVHKRKGFGLLVDMRKGRLTKPGDEARLLDFARTMRAGFAAVATVLETAVGKLQASRFRREGSVEKIFLASTVEEAHTYLIEQLAEQRRSARALH